MEILNTLTKFPLFYWAYKRGGRDAFPLAQKDVLETMRDDINAQANELAEKKLAQMLSNVDLSSIVSVDKRTNILYIGGKIPDVARIANLKSEAELFLNSDLLTLLSETPKELAQRAMFIEDGDLELQHTKGRAILYTIDTQKKIIDLIAGLSTGPNPPVDK